jgi:vitamin B12 transporter
MMKNMRLMAKPVFCLALVCTMALATPAWAAVQATQPSMVVTATRTTENVAEVSSSVSVITAKDIEEKGITDFADALRETPGLWVYGNGHFGGQTSISIRGAGAGQTSILLDGVRIADPISTDNSFNLGMYSVNGIGQIEVVRGPQSTLYGSQAMAGVVNIITEKGQGAPKAWLSLEGGSHNTMLGQMGTKGKIENLNFSVSASGLTTDGISKAKDTQEDDAYKRTQLNGRIGWEFSDKAELYFIGYFNNSDLDYDSFYGAPADSLDNEKVNSYTGIMGFDQKILDWWDHKITLSQGEIKRNYSDNSEYKSLLNTAKWQHNLHYKDLNTLTLGVDWEEEKGDYSNPLYFDSLPEKSTHTTGLFLQDRLSLFESLFINAGVRADDHSEFGGKTTYRLGAAYLLKDFGTTFKANYGTGFKAPSLYQLYSPYGNKDLDPEESTGWDVGVEQKLWQDKIRLGLTYFELKTDDLIAWNFATWKYYNVNEAKSHGIEAFASIEVCPWLTLDGTYTLTDTEDESTGKELIYRPKDKVSFGAKITPMEKLIFRLYGIYVGDRYSDAANTEKVDGYITMNASANYKLNEVFTLFGRVVNLFDEDYEEVKDYNTLGFSTFFGIRAEF